MESFIVIINGVAWIVAGIGIALSAVFIVWSGYLFISSQGDPQGIARARMSLIGVVIGIVIIGGAFIIPGTISRFVIEPAGGIKIDPRAAVDCDGIFRTQLVFQRSANQPPEMQYVINRVQAQNDECDREMWSPFVRTGAGEPPGCRDGWEVGGVLVPETSLRVSGGLVNNPVTHSFRDSDNNIIVYFVHLDDTSEPNRGLPSNGAICWMYVSAFSAWSEGYRPIPITP